jgi:GntR family transcriptional regulator/MocR family aminotransferase
MEATVAELLDEGELQRHMRKMRTAYARRRDVLVKRLRAELDDVLAFDVPAGGISVWGRARRGVNVPRWLAAASRRGVAVTPGRRYTFDGSEPGAVRLVFARFSESELTRAVGALRQAWESGR